MDSCDRRNVHMTMDTDYTAVSSVRTSFEISAEPCSIVMNKSTTDVCVTVSVTVDFLCPFPGTEGG